MQKIQKKTRQLARKNLHQKESRLAAIANMARTHFTFLSKTKHFATNSCQNRVQRVVFKGCANFQGSCPKVKIVNN